LSLQNLFHPESVAVIGASPNIMPGKLPYFQMLKIAGFPGKLYPINPKYTEIDGIKAYPTIESLPEPVDLLIASIPSKFALETVKSAAKKGIRFVHFFTSGFGEIGEHELENEIRKVKGQTRILGPNCIGVHCTNSRVLFDPFFKEHYVGNAAFLSQSGGITTNFIWMCQSRHIQINKVVSYGNQLDITAEEIIDYFADDAEINVISAYIEDIKNGKKFLEAVKKATEKKPVVILKGGRTEVGAKAASSHTGAMAGRQDIWSAAMKQTGCIQADTFEQLIDVVMLASSNKVPKGRRIGFICAGGGTAVLFTDLACMHGLELPNLEQKSQAGILETIKAINTSTRNPVDLGAYGFDFNIVSHAMKMMDKDENIDVIVPYFSLDFMSSFQRDQLESGPRFLIEEAAMLKKPVVPIFSKYTEDNLEKEEARIKIFRIFRDAGLPVFNNIQDFVFSMKEMLGWSAKPK